MLTGTPVRRRAKSAARSSGCALPHRRASMPPCTDLANRTGIRASRLARKAIRELVTGGVDLLNREQQAVLELARQMRLIGINLNQIARQMNRGDGSSRSLGRSRSKSAARGADRKRIHLAPPGRRRTGTDSAGAWP